MPAFRAGIYIQALTAPVTTSSPSPHSTPTLVQNHPESLSTPTKLSQLPAPAKMTSDPSLEAATNPQEPETKPEWTRPPDFDARLARVEASLPDRAGYATMSRDEQIAHFEARIAAVRKVFPEFPAPKFDAVAEGTNEEKGRWYVKVVDYGRLVRVGSPPLPLLFL